MAILTEADLALLPQALRSAGGFHVATKWYCKGWEPLWYQYDFHQLDKPNVSFLAGIAAGKTTTVAASFLIDCLTTPYFRALNTSVTSKQAELPFEMVMAWIDGNPRLEHLIENIQQRPYPTITFKNYAEWVFRTAGQNAQFIRGMEFDRINYDEAGLDFAGETVKVLRGRLRGKRPDGTTRLGRMDVITSPTGAPWLRERFDRGDKDSPTYDPEGYASMRVRTYYNTHLTALQIKMMENEYSDDMIDVELNAQFPDYGMSTFPSSHVLACTDQSLNDAVETALSDAGKAQKGYRLDVHPRYGVTLFELPYIPGHVYVMGGDPGTDGPPKRNAPVVIVADVSVKPMKLVYFHWIDGRGAYTPFLSSFKYAMEKYRCRLRGIDITGTQKAIDELAFENFGIAVDGLSFNRDKEAMINCLIDDVSEHRWTWPVIAGLQRQLMSYVRAEDRKIPQDIVMTIAEVSYLSRFIQEGEPGGESSGQSSNPSSAYRNRRRQRTTANRCCR
jgi:hypothetical protein